MNLNLLARKLVDIFRKRLWLKMNVVSGVAEI